MYTSETLPIPLVSHSSVSPITILITTQRCLSGVKRKTLAAAPSIICSIFHPCRGRRGPSQGRLTKAGRYVPRKHGWNLAPGQMGILSTRGGWNVFFVGGSVMCWREEGVASESVPNSPQLSLAERCICDVNMWGADENMNLKQR